MNDTNRPPKAPSEKHRLRAHCRAERQALSAAEREQQSQLIAARVEKLEAFQTAGGIALFYPLLKRGEVNVLPLAHSTLAQNKRLYLPFLNPGGRGNEGGFAQVTDIDDLADRGRGFREPQRTEEPARRGDINFIVVPALAVTPLGHRLGYGGGFYDTLLPTLCPPAISCVVAFEVQVKLDVPREPHDRACDLVVTDVRSVVCRNND